MKTKRLSVLHSFIFSIATTAVISLFIAGCASDGMFDQMNTSSSSYRGYVVVASASAVNTAPGALALFDPEGNFVRSLGDYYTNAELPSGVAVFGETVLAAIEGSDRIEVINSRTGALIDSLTYTGISSSPLRQVTVDATGNLYVAEYNASQLEKVDSNYTRVGNPFIAATTGSCTLVNPWGIAYIPSTDQIVVTNYNGGRLLIYDADLGTCVSSVNNAIYTSGNPMGIVYHSQTNKLLMTRLTNDAVYVLNIDGSSPTIAYQNTTRVNDPYTIDVDADGYVYIGSSVQDTVEKFSFDGTTLTPATSGPLIGPNVYTQNPTQIWVIK